ncbi:response regulator transcription factor [Halosquirtibacter laminarini]|uniref:Response regulator transcription factor n=1 Tax=Halosquirtibacter laminarini TaxID=3374600 RepID=A0AC61NG93_9BACT|nr:response regulator transcription factor [Prolixibacteraceae bacterium]
MNKERILVVDDEEDICEIIKFNLENEGYDVSVAYSAEEALKLDLNSYNLLLLDVMMGEISGFKLANTLKNSSRFNNIPLIFITAKGAENDTLTGFSLGADDYIQKPFSIKEVIARVKAVLTRSHVALESNEEVWTFQGLQIDVDGKIVIVDGNKVSLSKKEFEILALLTHKAGKVYSREDIIMRVWNDEDNVLDRTVDVNVTRLRKKIGTYGKRIVTRQGYGYCFDNE